MVRIFPSTTFRHHMHVQYHARNKSFVLLFSAFSCLDMLQLVWPCTCVCFPQKGASSPDAIVEEDESASVSSDWSDVSEENEVAPSQARKDADANAAAARLDPGEAEDEPSDGIDLVDDPDIRNAIEDFDSRNWTMDQLEVSCQTLLEECYASEERRRRLLSAGMLRKLVEIYPSALR